MFNLDEVYPISKFVQLCAKMINNNIPMLWVSGEVSNIATPNSGHIYFSLKDNKSQIRCVLFRLSQRNLKFKLENGQQIMVRAAPSLYEIRADFQLIIQRAEPIGVGSLELGFEQLKKKLQAQGIFADKHKKSLPKTPKNIGVITSKSGAVVYDIIEVLAKRYPFANVVIYDTKTQGDGASIEIINALQNADNNRVCDVLIIARGGGSREDLWCFNDEDLALAVFEAKTPIISSIGHETDTTIIDFVADKSVPTPSAAAMIATPDKVDILQIQDTLDRRLKNLTQNKFDHLSQMLLKFTQRLTQPNFYKRHQLIESLMLRLVNVTKNHIKFKQSELKTLYARIHTQSPNALIYKKQRENQDYKQRLLIVNHQIKLYHTQLTSLQARMLRTATDNLARYNVNLLKNITALNHLSPLQVLERGYSITSIKNKVIYSSKELRIGDEISTKFANSDIKSKIIK